MAFEQAMRAACAAVARGEIPMAVVGVAVGGAIVDREAVHADPDDLVHVASITKPIVATAAMRLVSRSELDLAAPLSVRQELTAAHVLTHTTGLP